MWKTLLYKDVEKVTIRLSVGQLMKQKVAVKETVTTDSIDCN